MLRSKSKPIVYVFGWGRGLLAKKTPALSRLGTKRQCLACGAKYYDLGRKPPVCSRCGASAEPKRASGHVEERAGRPGCDSRDAAIPRSRGPIFTADRPRMVARAGGRDRPGRPVAQTRRAPGVSRLRLRGRRQDDACAPHRRGRARRDGVRRLHRQGRAGDAIEGLRGRDDHPCAHLPGERGRGRRAQFHPQRRWSGLEGRAHRDRRMFDGRRGAGARPPLVRQADPGPGRPVPAAARQRAAAFSPRARRTSC